MYFEMVSFCSGCCCCCCYHSNTAEILPSNVQVQGPATVTISKSAGDSRLQAGLVLRKVEDPKSYVRFPCWRATDSRGHFISGDEAITLCLIDDRGGHEKCWSWCVGWEDGPNYKTSMPKKHVDNGLPNLGCLYITSTIEEAADGQWSDPPKEGYRRVLFCDAPVAYTGPNFIPGGQEPGPVITYGSNEELGAAQCS